MNAYISAFKRYFDFKGRTSRKDFWMFTLVNAIVTTILKVILQETVGLHAAASVEVISFAVLLGYYMLLIIPGTAIAVRRLHDTDRSGWWVLLLFINLIFFCQKGTTGDNRFGPDPLQNA